jgi:hypothetical protein
MTLGNPVLRLLRYIRYLARRRRQSQTLPDGRKKQNAPGVLSFVRTDDGQQTVAFQKLAYGFISVEVRAAPHVVMHEILWALLLPKVLDRVRP